MFEEIRSVMVESLSVKEDEVTLDANLRDDLGIDSLDAAELVMELEDQFSLKIEEAEAAKFVLVKDIVNFIENAQKTT